MTSFLSIVAFRNEQESGPPFLLSVAYFRKPIELSWHWCSSSSTPTHFSRIHGELHEPVQYTMFLQPRVRLSAERPCCRMRPWWATVGD